MTDNSGLAVVAINTIYEMWMVDASRAEWIGDPSASTLRREGYGFDWWPGDFKVEVRAKGPDPAVDFPVYRLSVRTDYLCDVDVTDPKFKQVVSDFNRLAPTFAICALPTTQAHDLVKHRPLSQFGPDLRSSRVWLASTAYLDEAAKDWLPQFFGKLAFLQPIESQFRAKFFLSLFAGKADRSRPPGHASRTNLDHLLYVERAAIAPEGERQSKWVATGEFLEIIDKWGCSEAGVGVADRGGLTLEMPFGDTTATLVLRTDLPHPRLGNGLHAALKLPCLANAETINTVAIQLNHLESRMWSKAGTPLIGNWYAERNTPGDPESGFVPAFSFFLPNFIYELGLAEHFVLHAMARARWGREVLLPNESDLPLHEILDKRFNQKPQ